MDTIKLKDILIKDFEDAVFCVSRKNEEKFVYINCINTNGKQNYVRISNYYERGLVNNANCVSNNCIKDEVDYKKEICEFFIRNEEKIDTLIQEDIIKQSNDLMGKIVQTTTEEGLFLKSLKEFTK